MVNQSISILLQVIAIVGIISAVVYGMLLFYRDYREKKIRELETFHNSFDSLVEKLTSDNMAAQLSSAILLRRYFKISQEDEEQDIIDSRIAKWITSKQRKYLRPIDLKYKKDLKIETVGVISSLLRTLPTGVFQKTLADGLGYASDLSKCDLQKTNLQDVLLDNKSQVIIMDETDLFLADLSFANLEGIKGHGIILYDAILFCARIKNCDFTNGNFRGADLTGVSFKNCDLSGADFTGAKNIPPSIRELLKNGIFPDACVISAKHESKGKFIFFSMPGVLNKEDEIITKDYKRILEKNGYDVIYYRSDDYPRFGQFNRVREAIMKSSGMIAFGLKQIHIPLASYRPGTEKESLWDGKWLSTPWSEIEVGMGLMKGMPILLVCDPVIKDGVFDDGLSECFVAKISTNEDSRRLEYNKSFVEWMSKL